MSDVTVSGVTAVRCRGVWRPVRSTSRDRFPGLANGWARFDGPAGTQVVDTAIDASADWQRSGNNANSHGAFAAAEACDALVERTQATMGELLGADPAGFVFGPSTTNNVFSITRAIGRELGPGDEIVCTRLDHDSNVSPWLLIAADTGATVRMAEFDTATGRLDTAAVTALLDEHTRWVAVTGASNAIGTMPDITAITAAAHQVGAKVVVDGVHLTPHAPVDLGAVGCDVYSTSSYKWYGPHAGITWVEPELLDRLQVYKVRPSPDTGPGRLQLGTPAYESLAAIEAAARFLIGEGMTTIAGHERALFTRLLDGLLVDAERPRARPARHGRPGADARVPRRRSHPQRGRPRPRRPRDRGVGRQLLRRRGDGQLRPRRRQRRGPRRASPPTPTSPTSSACSTPSPTSERRC